MKSIFKTFLLSVLVVAQMHFAYAQTASILPPAKTTFLDANGKPLTAGTVESFIPSTSTHKTTWQDAAETIPNANPLTLDAAGRALLLGSGSYRQVVKDRLNNVIWDQVTSSTGSGGGGGSTATGDGDLVGTIKPWAGMTVPNQYVFTYGQELSRTTYSALFTAITSTQAVFCNSGSPILNGLGDTTNFWVGMTVELSCVASGFTTVISKTATTVTLALNSNVTTNTNAVFFPWGRGNGSTTFNMPDFRGFVLAGNNIMGGVSGSQLTTAFFGATDPNSIGASGGNQSHAVILSEMAGHNHSITDPGHTHSTQVPPLGNTGALAGGQNYVGAPVPVTSTNNVTNITVTSNGGGIATSSIVATVGSGYTNGAQTITIAGGTCTTQPQFTVTVAGNIFTGTPALLTAGSCTVAPVNPAATTGGGGAGGTLNVSYSAQPISLIQPTKTSNYIIKVLPDDNSATASGVTALGGMTGSIACGTGLLCTGNTISVVTINTFRLKIPTNIFYVDDINGNDGNLCTTPTTGACKTLNGAVAIVGSYDLNGQTILVNVAAPTTSYAGMSCLNPWVGDGSVTFIGDITTPLNVKVAGGASAAFDIENGCSVGLRGFSTSSTGNHSVEAVLGGRIVMSKMDLGAGAAAFSVVYSSRVAAYLEINDFIGSTTIHTGVVADNLLQATHSGELRVNCTGACLVLTANVTYASYTAMVQTGSIIATPSASFNLGAFAVTSNKYQIQSNGTIQWNGVMPPLETDIPGTASTGVYLGGSVSTGPGVVSTGGTGAATSALLLQGGTLGTCFQKQDGLTNVFCVDASGAPSFLLAPLPASSGGSGATAPTGALKGNGASAFTQAACADLSNGTTNCSAAVGQLPGTTTNDNAAVGKVGEYIEARCRGNNTTATVTITIATPAVITWAANPFSGTAPRFDLCPIVLTTTGALPTGLTAGTPIYIIPSTISGNNFSVATSVVNALAGTAINTTGSQSGVQTGTAGLPLTTGNTVNLGALSLTAGDWDVAGSDLFTGGATTNVQTLTTFLSTTSVDTTLTPGYYSSWFTNGNVPFASIVTMTGFPLGPSRFSLSATTSVFYILNPVFITSTLNGYPAIRARRVR